MKTLYYLYGEEAVSTFVEIGISGSTENDFEVLQNGLVEIPYNTNLEIDNYKKAMNNFKECWVIIDEDDANEIKQGYQKAEPQKTLLQRCKEALKGKSLNQLLEEITVEHPEDDKTSPVFNWYPVANHEGIIAYFGDQEQAYKFRLDLINAILNC